MMIFSKNYLDLYFTCALVCIVDAVRPLEMLMLRDALLKECRQQLQNGTSSLSCHRQRTAFAYGQQMQSHLSQVFRRLNCTLFVRGYEYKRTLSSRDGQQLRLSYRLLAHILYVVRPELGRVAAKKPPASEMLRVLQDATKVLKVLRDANIYNGYSYVRVNLNNNIKEVLLQHVCFI